MHPLSARARARLPKGRQRGELLLWQAPAVELLLPCVIRWSVFRLVAVVQQPLLVAISRVHSAMPGSEGVGADVARCATSVTRGGRDGVAGEGEAQRVDSAEVESAVVAWR